MQFSLFTLLLILLLLIGLSAFFAGAEIGMMSLNRYRLRHLVRKQNRQAIRINDMLAKPEKLLSVVLIGNTLANIMASMVATMLGQQWYGDIGALIAAVVLTLIILVFSEMAPKTLAAIHPQQVAFVVALPLMIMQKVLAPLVYVVSRITSGLLRFSGFSLDRSQREALTSEELRTVVNEAGVLLPLEHKSMLLSLLDLELATVEDIMVPRADIVGIDLSQSWYEVLEQLETTQHTRLPLFKDSIDNLIGMVHVRSVLALTLEDRLNKDNLIKIAHEPYYVPEETPLNLQILNFQKMKERSCFVVDEYGDLQGLVTLEDILEEVVGEFTTDMATLGKDIIPQGDGSVIVDASITLRHLKRALGWQLPKMGPRTLSGLIIEYLGYIPPPDCCLRIKNYQIDILKVNDNMVKTVRMWSLGYKN